MPRLVERDEPLSVADQERLICEEFERALATLSLGLPREKKPRRAPPPSLIEKFLSRVRDRIERDDWEGCGAVDAVAFYYLCHERAYGTPPLELAGEEWQKAQHSAAALTKSAFGGDYLRLMHFVRWTWGRELGREQWRKENDRETRRLTWYVQFCKRYLLTDFEVATDKTRA